MCYKANVHRYFEHQEMKSWDDEELTSRCNIRSWECCWRCIFLISWLNDINKDHNKSPFAKGPFGNWVVSVVIVNVSN